MFRTARLILCSNLTDIVNERKFIKYNSEKCENDAPQLGLHQQPPSLSLIIIVDSIESNISFKLFRY